MFTRIQRWLLPDDVEDHMRKLAPSLVAMMALVFGCSVSASAGARDAKPPE